MAYANIKVEMKGDRARWVTRNEAKAASKKIRRTLDKRAIKEAL